MKRALITIGRLVALSAGMATLLGIVPDWKHLGYGPNDYNPAATGLVTAVSLMLILFSIWPLLKRLFPD